MMNDYTAQQPTRILLIRHGQSVANAGGTPPDHITNPLTELGHAQAKAFADGFSCEPTLFLISPYTRAQQTSVPLRQRYRGVAHLRVQLSGTWTAQGHQRRTADAAH